MIILNPYLQFIISSRGDVMICDTIRQLRENAGFSQAVLAKKLNVTRSAVNAWEMGLSVPTTQYVVDMAKLFRVSTDYLLGYSDVRCGEELRKLNQAFQGLPEAERESLMDYLDFLSAKQKRPKH